MRAGAPFARQHGPEPQGLRAETDGLRGSVVGGMVLQEAARSARLNRQPTGNEGGTRSLLCQVGTVALFQPAGRAVSRRAASVTRRRRYTGRPLRFVATIGRQKGEETTRRGQRCLHARSRTPWIYADGGALRPASSAGRTLKGAEAAAGTALSTASALLKRSAARRKRGQDAMNRCFGTQNWRLAPNRRQARSVLAPRDAHRMQSLLLIAVLREPDRIRGVACATPRTTEALGWGDGPRRGKLATSDGARQGQLRECDAMNTHNDAMIVHRERALRLVD